jgi:hypothetical protein
MLGRMPKADLTFVLAGGDVVIGDRLGKIGLSFAEAQARDLEVAKALEGRASVWLPGGGYSADSWKVLAGTAIAIGLGIERKVNGDPLAARYRAIADRLDPRRLGAEPTLDAGEIEAQLLGRPVAKPRLLGFYTAEGVEYALFQYGILSYLERLGYRHPRVEIEASASGGERASLWAHADEIDAPAELLIDVALERTQLEGEPMLYIHWVNLRNPRQTFPHGRRPLPGQDVPGLGLAREMAELFRRMAERIGAVGLAFRPAHYHMAYVARTTFRFADPVRQGRFEAMVRDLGSMPLDHATSAVSEGRVLEDGKPYTWEADLMVYRFAGQPSDEERVAREREARRFSITPAPQ